MGSRWWFYPIRVVTGDTMNIRRARIVSLPWGVPSWWKGKTLGTFLDAVRACDEDEMGAWLNGYAPCPLRLKGIYDTNDARTRSRAGRCAPQL